MSRPQITLGIAVLACGSLILCAAAADPKTPGKPRKATVQQKDSTPAEPDGKAGTAKPDADEDLGPWEVTERVELIYKEELKVAGEKTLSAKVQLKNKSEDDLPGKLVLVIDGSSVSGTKLHEPQGQFTETTPYLQMIPAKRKLEAGKESAARTLILTSDSPLSEKKAELEESPTLRWRAYTLTKPADLESDIVSHDKKVPGKDYTWGEMHRIMAIQDKATVDLVLKHDGAILGTGTSEDADGKLVIRVFASRGGMSKKIPGEIEGVPVEITVTGTINAGPAFSRVTYEEGRAAIPGTPEPEAAPGPEAEKASSTAAKGTSGTAFSTVQSGVPTSRFRRPVPIGVSAFNQTDVCAAGTLGCRCIGRDGSQYALSNCHVFGIVNAGVNGNAICQPSQGDNSCARPATDVIGNLSNLHRLQFFTAIASFRAAPINTMDAAIALCPAGMVDVSTPRVGYGTPSRFPQESLFVGMPVQKCGRTTAFTKGKIYSLNIETVVNFGSSRLARFRSCIGVQTQLRTPAFGAPGDSGSLVVTVADRRPVGILFAGGGYDTFLNPISPVLHRFGVGVDDGTGSKPVLGSGRMGTASGPVEQHKNVVIPLSK